MSEIEKMQRYIERTKIRRDKNYSLDYRKSVELLNATLNGEGSAFDVIALAFDYGKAKGYRAAKAEVRK